MMTEQQAYAEGFMKAAEAYGVDPYELAKFAQAQAPAPAPAPSAYDPNDPQVVAAIQRLMMQRRADQRFMTGLNGLLGNAAGGGTGVDMNKYRAMAGQVYGNLGKDLEEHAKSTAPQGRAESMFNALGAKLNNAKANGARALERAKPIVDSAKQKVKGLFGR